MAPSSFVEKEDILKAEVSAEAAGYRVLIHPQTFSRYNQSAGTTDEKARALHDLYQNPEVDVIIAAGGGNRALHLLDYLDYDLIAANPKYLAGFSDVTALLNAIYARCGLPGIHGPVFKKIPSCRQSGEFFDLLGGNAVSMPLDNAMALRSGEAEGVLIGGNLSVFQYLPGTDYMPESEGAILFLEDWNEEASHIDRMFLYLRRCGVLEKVSALVLGDFSLKDTGRPFGFTLEDIVLEHTRGLDIPVLMNAPFGHGSDLWPLPVGERARVTVSTGSKALILSGIG